MSFESSLRAHLLWASSVIAQETLRIDEPSIIDSLERELLDRGLLFSPEDALYVPRELLLCVKYAPLQVAGMELR